MLKKQITYEDPFGEGEISKTFYFNLTKAEITEWEYSIQGGLSEHLSAIMDDPENNATEIMATMKAIILKSYGVREGADFVKSDELRKRFESSEAYSQLFWELCTQADAAAEFINAIVPKEMNENQTALPLEGSGSLKERFAQALATKEPDAPNSPNLEQKTEPRLLTQAELEDMDSDELKSGLATGKYRVA